MSDDRRISVLEQQHVQTGARLDAIEGAINKQSLQLERMYELLSRHEAEPKFDPYNILQFITTATVLAGMIAGAIIYVATNTQAERFAVLETQMKIMMQAETVIAKTGAR